MSTKIFIAYSLAATFVFVSVANAVDVAPRNPGQPTIRVAGIVLKWLRTDKEYARGGYKKEQSVSIIGSGPGLDWTGTRPRTENLKKIVPGFS